MLATFSNLLKSFEDLFFPPLCACCQQPLVAAEEILCMDCLLKLPLTNFHLLKNNPVVEKFKGRIPVRAATSLLFFTQQSRTQQLIHQLKYQGKTKIGIYLGKIFGESLSRVKWLEEMDLMLPVPLHPKKEKIRGYNQSVLIAKGIERIMGLKVAPKGILIKNKHTESQTKKNGLERLNNVKDVFQLCQPEFIDGKNVLLIDDVLTTGATLESCGMEVWKGRPKSISIGTLAFATDI